MSLKIRYQHASLHKFVTVVQQEPVLFARSIKDNILYGIESDKDAEMEIDRVTKLSSAHEFISNMTEGLDTNCGEKGQQLSGGQKQRIAIARSLGNF
jgi:ABC-type multidrug transport system fused ATPase/permease subunit